MEVFVFSESEAKSVHFLNEPVEQAWAWGVLQTQIHGRPEFRVFGVRDSSGECIAKALAIRQEMTSGRWGSLLARWVGGASWLWLPRGPVFCDGLPEKDTQAAWKLLLEACRNWGRLHGAVFLRVEPGFFSTDFDLGGHTSHEEYLPSHTLCLDLTLTEEALLAQMTQKGRYNIKMAAKQGVTVDLACDEDWRLFYELLKETGARDGFGVHSLGFYRAMKSILGEHAQLFVARYQGRVIGGLLLTVWNGLATYYFGASSSQDRSVMAPYALQWHAICWARKLGAHGYDFLGIAPDGEAAHPLAGVTQFKTRFGGLRKQTAGSRVWIYRPVLFGLRATLRRLRASLKA